MITDGSSLEEIDGFETSITVETKTTTLRASEEVQVDGIKFTLNMTVSKVHQGLTYSLEVLFDVQERREKVFAAIRSCILKDIPEGYVLMQGWHGQPL